MPPRARPAELGLVEVPPGPANPTVEVRARYLPWLREPRQQLELVVDGTHLCGLLLAVEVPDDTSGLTETFDLVSVADPV